MEQCHSNVLCLVSGRCQAINSRGAGAMGAIHVFVPSPWHISCYVADAHLIITELLDPWREGTWKPWSMKDKTS